MNIPTYFIILIFILFIGACNGTNSDANKPGKIAVDVYEAITSGDTETLKDNLYISNRQQRETFFRYFDIAISSEQYKNNVKEYTPSYKVVEEKIDGDRAIITLSGINPLGEKVRITVEMLKIDGKWKVDGDHGIWHGK